MLKEFCKSNLAYLSEMTGVTIRVINNLKTYLEKEYYFDYFGNLDGESFNRLNIKHDGIESVVEEDYDNIGIILGDNKWEDISIELIPFLTILYMNYDVSNIQVIFYGYSSRNVLQFESIEELESIVNNDQFISGGYIIRQLYINIKR